MIDVLRIWRPCPFDDIEKAKQRYREERGKEAQALVAKSSTFKEWGLATFGGRCPPVLQGLQCIEDDEMDSDDFDLGRFKESPNAT